MSSLSRRDCTPDHHSRRQHPQRRNHPRRNRTRHEPLPDRRTPDLLGRPVPRDGSRRASGHGMAFRRGAWKIDIPERKKGYPVASPMARRL
jgi:hypothetical protein